ncbi:hypothetical protein ACEE08_11330 [Staphylococcus rostri]
MPMSKQEAINILQKLEDLYDMGFNQNKQKTLTWVEMLMNNGDYQLTLNKLKNFIKISKYKPNIADILADKPKPFIPDEKPIDQTHAYKLEHDPAYKKEWEEVRDKAREFVKELRNHD